MIPRAGQEADWIEGLCPEEFQRLALDLLRNHIEGVRPYDLPHGRTDGGFDGELVGSFGGLSGRVRVSVKGNGSFAKLKKDAVKDAKDHPALPMLLVARVRLSESQQHKILDAVKDLVPDAAVIDGGTLASWLRDLPHLRASWWGDEGGLQPMSARLSEPPRPEGRSELGPWLRTEAMAVRGLWQAIVDRRRLVLLAASPHTRGERCLGGFGRSLDRCRRGPAVLWADLSRGRPTDLGPRQRGAVVLVAPKVGEEEVVLRWAERQWREKRDCVLVLLVPDYRAETVGALFRGDSTEQAIVALPRPSTYDEVERLTRWLCSKSAATDVQRRNLAAIWELRPLLLEASVRQPVLAIEEYTKEFDHEARRLLGLRALVAERAGREDLEQWADEISGLSPAARGAALTRAVREGWLQAQTGLPTASGPRWLMIHAWLEKDITALKGLLRSDPPDEALLGLAWADRADEIEVHMLSRLRSHELRQVLPLVGRMPASTERLTRALIDEASRVLETLSPEECRLLAAALEKATRWPALVPSAMALGLRLHERGLRYLFDDPKGHILTWFTNPSRRISSQTAIEGLRWIIDRLSELDPKVALSAAAPWLLSAVEFQESGPDVVSFGAAGWNPDNPHVHELWALSTEILTVLLRRLPMVEAAWEALRPIGSSPADPQRPTPHAQAPFLRRLLVDALECLPFITDPYQRGLADSTLLVQVLHGPDRGFVDDTLARAILAALSRDPRVSAAMAAMAIPRPIVDPDALLIAYEGGGARAVKREYKARAGDFARLAARLVEAEVDSDDLLSLLTVIHTRTERGRGPLGMDLFGPWARLGPRVFEPVVLGDRWAEVPRDLQGALLRVVAPVFGSRLLGRPNPQTPSPGRFGAAVRIHRLLERPERADVDETIPLLPALEELLEPKEVMGVMFRLAGRTEGRLRIALLQWLWRHLRHRKAVVDPRDLEAMLGRVVAPPVSVDVLAAVVEGAWLPEQPHRDLLLTAALGAFERLLLADPDADIPLAPPTHGPTWALYTTLMTRAPNLGLPLLNRLSSAAQRTVLSELPAEACEAMLRACPDPLDARERLVIVDQLVKRLPLDRTEALIRESSPERGRVLLIAANAAEALKPLVDELAQGIESREEREKWLRKVRFGSLLFYKRVGPPTLIVDAAEDPPSRLPAEEPDN